MRLLDLASATCDYDRLSFDLLLEFLNFPIFLFEHLLVLFLKIFQQHQQFLFLALCFLCLFRRFFYLGSVIFLIMQQFFDELDVILHHHIEILPLLPQRLLQLLLEDGTQLLDGCFEAEVLLFELMILVVYVLAFSVLEVAREVVDGAVEHVLHRFVLFVQQIVEEVAHGLAPVLVVLWVVANGAGWRVAVLPFFDRLWLFGGFFIGGVALPVAEIRHVRQFQQAYLLKYITYALEICVIMLAKEQDSFRSMLGVWRLCLTTTVILSCSLKVRPTVRLKTLTIVCIHNKLCGLYCSQQILSLIITIISMINLTKYFSRTLQQFQSAPLPMHQGPLLSPWRSKPSLFVKHSPIIAKRQMKSPHKQVKPTLNPESNAPSAQTSLQSTRKNSLKSVKTCPSLDCKDRIHLRSSKKRMSSSKLPLLVSHKDIKLTLKKGQAKGHFRQFIESKCKENQRKDKKSINKIVNHFRISQLRDTLFERKNELIKTRAIKLK